MKSVNPSTRNVGARRRETSGATTTTTTLRSSARVEAVPQLAHSLLSSKEDGDLVHPLPREFNIVDPSRDAGDYLIPVSVDDDLHVLVPEGYSTALKSRDVHLVSRTSQHRHPTERHQLKEFETVEALLRDASMAEVNNIHSQGDDSDIDSNEDDDNEQIHVLKELNALGSRIDAARRANSQHLCSHTAPPASTSYTASSYQSEQQAPTPSALFLLEKEASSLISFSLSNPKMQMYAREVAKRQTTAEVSQPHHAGAAGDLTKETVTTTTTKAVHHAHQHSSSAAPDIAAPPPQDSSQNSTTVAAAAILTGMNTNLSQAIANQQVALESALEEHRKKQEAALLVHREAMGQAQEDAQSKANAALKREINALKRQQQELLRQQKELELERRHEGSGGRPVGLAAPSSITVDGGHHHHHHQKPAASATDLATNAIVRNIPQETASLIANALQSERTKMADERRQWERTMQEVQEGAAAQQQALLKQMKVLSGQQEAAVQQAAAHALRKAQTTHEKHAERIAKLMELQQRQHVHDLRVDNSLSRQQQQQQATTATKRPGSLTLSPANAVAAEIQAKKDQLASSKSAVSFDLPEGSDSSPAALQTILLDTTGSEVQASDLLSTTTRRQMSEAAAGTGPMRLGAILARKAKPTKAVITPSPASPIPKKEDLSASTHQQDSGAAHSRSRRSKTGTAPGSPSATSNSSSSPIPVTTEEDTTKETHRKHDSDAVPTDRDKVASFLNQATKALVDGGAVADVFLQSGSEANSPIPLIILTDAQGLAAEATSAEESRGGAEHEPVQCVEMCVAMFMSEDRAAELVGASKRTARDPLSAAPRLLTKEEAELLIDARRRLQRIQAFSIDFSSPNRRDSDDQQEGEEEVIPCFVGEEADALLLNVITKKLVHEVLAENIRGFLHDFERAHQGDGSSEETSGDAKVHLFPSTGSQGLDRLVLEECLQEYLNTPALVNEIHVRNASTASGVDTSPVTTQQQQRASKLPVGVVELLRLNATKQNEVLEQALWQEWMLVQADMLREKNEQSAEAQKAVRIPVTGDESHPTWLTDNTSPQSATQPLTPHQQQAAPVVNVVVDTSSIADLLRNWGRNLAPSSLSEGIHPGTYTSASLPSSTSAASPRYLQQEASRHPQLDEELPTTSDGDANSAQGVAGQPSNHNNVKRPMSLNASSFNLDDVESAVTERVLRKLYGQPGGMPPPNFGPWGAPPGLFPIGALPPPPNPQNLSGHELSGVSSSSSASSSSSSTSSSSSSEDNTISPELEAFIRSPQVQTVFSTEAVQRYRFYNDVDQIFTFLREAFAEEHSNIVRSLAQRLPFNALQASGSAAAVSATAQQQGGQVQPHQQPQQSLATAPTVHTGTITDPITSFLVEWFKTLQVHELPTVLQQQLSHSAAAAPVVPPTTLATLYDAAGRQEQQRIGTVGRPAITPSTSMVSSTNPSSFGDDGMHKFTRYLPADYVEKLHHPERANGGTHLRPWRRDDGTATTETTLVETDTTVTTTDAGHDDNSSSEFQRVFGVPKYHNTNSTPHYYPQHHQHYQYHQGGQLPQQQQRTTAAATTTSYNVNAVRPPQRRADPDTSSTSTGTHTTISSVSSDDVRRTLARGAMHQMTAYEASYGGYFYGGRQIAPSLNQSELTAGSRL